MVFLPVVMPVLADFRRYSGRFAYSRLPTDAHATAARIASVVAGARITMKNIKRRSGAALGGAEHYRFTRKASAFRPGMNSAESADSIAAAKWELLFAQCTGE